MKSRNLGAAYGSALDCCNRAEREMLRAIHRWEKYRDELKRAERRLDEAEPFLSELTTPARLDRADELDPKGRVVQ